MSDSPETLDQQIAELEADLQQPLSETTRRRLMADLQALHAQRAAWRASGAPPQGTAPAPAYPAETPQPSTQHQSGGVNLGQGNTIDSIGEITGGDKVAGHKVDEAQGAVIVSGDGHVDGIVVGINLGKIIYGRSPEEDERRRLVWYLANLANTLIQLPLRGLEERLEQGKGLGLPQVYVRLATNSLVEVARGRAQELQRYYQDGKLDQPLKPDYHRDHALPDQAIVEVTPLQEGQRQAQALVLSRSMLATEAVQQHHRLVLLGDPGSGKSTFLRHLAWALALRGLDQLRDVAALQGWDDQRRLLPIMLPLRTLAGRLATQGLHETTVSAALREAMHGCGVQQVDDLLNEALHRGVALVLFDGLDEVPIEGVPGVTVDRTTIVAAVRAFAQRYAHTPIVVTCRTRAFDEQLRVALGWPSETLAPFTLGQMRHFVASWYRELVAKGQLEQAQAARLERDLIATIVASPKLRAMAGTPLLLTMMALILYNKGELPRDRPQLYERILELLLGQWDKVHAGQSLAEALGQADWGSERIMPLLDQLAYEAHLGTAAEGELGRLARGAVRDALIAFFETARLPEPWGAARRCLDYIEQRSGLLMPDGPDSYVFAHLTLQEHCAGRHIALNADDPVALVLRHRDDDRWREPIFLGMGLVHPAVLNSLLTDLLDREESGQPKARERWYRDLILAAEIGKDRDWDYLRTRPMVKVERLQRDLGRGLVELLTDKTQLLPVRERVRAAFLLGELGDPRFPVELERWTSELAQRNTRFGAPAGYWCYVRGGRYRIGGWEQGMAAAEIELPAFWIARYLITVAQYAPFVQAGYGKDAQRWWTTEGWAWKQQRQRTQPWRWDDANSTAPNQPVIGVTWYEATAYCAWLSEQFADALPEGYVLRLPTEAEWEAAAAYDAAMQRRDYPWGPEAPTPERAIYNESNLGRPAPVGCCPVGAAACGALDMAGNAWEVTTSSYGSYPAGSNEEIKDFTTDDWDVPWRSGGWGGSSTLVRCGARLSYPPGDDVILNLGLRVVVAPRKGIADSR